MYAIPAAWIAQHNTGDKQIVVLVQLLGPGIIASNVPWNGGGSPWTFDHPFFAFDAGLAFDSAIPHALPYLLSIREGGASGMSQRLDPYDNDYQVGNVTIRLQNATDVYGQYPSLRLKSSVRVLLGVGQPLALSEFLPLFFGQIERIITTADTIELQCVPGALSWHRDITTRIGEQYFLDAPDDSKGKGIPLIFGTATNVDCLLITHAPQGTLAEAIDTLATTLLLTEYGASFDADGGTVDIGTETGVTYASAAQVTVEGVTYLQLVGLTRGAPASHPAGESVNGVLTEWRYIAGYDSNVLAVRDGGVSVAAGWPGGYLVTTVLADEPVTVLRFDAEPAGTVTADLEGRNLEAPASPIANGDFETGFTTGWTDVDTISVANTTDPYEGAYKAQVVADAFGVTGQFYQDVPVEVQRATLFSFAAQRRMDALASILNNGTFQTDDFTGWTYTATPTPPLQILPNFTGSIGVTFGYFYDLVVGAPSHNYVVVVEQIAASTPSDAYTLTSEHIMTGVLALTPYPFYFAYADMTVQVRDTDGSGAILFTSAYQWRSQSQGFEQRIDSLDGEIVAPGSALYVKVTYHGWSTGYPPPIATLRQIALTPVDNLSRAALVVGIGTDVDPYKYGLLDIRSGYNTWSTYVLQFTSEEPTARVSFFTDYDKNGLPVGAWLDAIEFLPTGRNPVDVIRWIIEHRIPGLRINESSFLAAYNARTEWRAGGQLRDPGYSLNLLRDIAGQHELLYFENNNGEAVLRDRRPALTIVGGFGSYNSRNFTIEDENPSLLGTSFFIFYGPKSGEAASFPGNYNGTVFATPDGASEISLQTFCQAAIAAYGVQQTRRAFLTTVQDKLTAILKLQRMVERHTLLGKLASFDVLTLRYAPLEIGDNVDVAVPFLSGGGQRATLTGIAWNMGRPALEMTARLHAPGASDNEWEPHVFIGGVESDNEWDAGVDSPAVPAADNEWEPHDFTAGTGTDYEWPPHDFTAETATDYEWETGPAS